MLITNIEEYKDIIWYEWLYQVSNLWNVKSLNYRWYWKEQVLKYNVNKGWYKYIVLCKDKKTQTSYIHKLVSNAFLEKKENLIINHKDWNKLNNYIDNLEWSTYGENLKHAWDNGLRKITGNNHFIKNHPKTWKWKFGKDNPSSKKVNQYEIDWTFIQTWHCLRDIQRELWIFQSQITWVCQWRRNTAKWFKWEYFNS